MILELNPAYLIKAMLHRLHNEGIEMRELDLSSANIVVKRL